MQRPGDVLYVPHGLPHAVHNLETNIALTKNQLFSVELHEWNDQELNRTHFQDAVLSLVKLAALGLIQHPTWNMTRGLHTLYMGLADRETRRHIRGVVNRIDTLLWNISLCTFTYICASTRAWHGHRTSACSPEKRYHLLGFYSTQTSNLYRKLQVLIVVYLVYA